MDNITIQHEKGKKKKKKTQMIHNPKSQMTSHKYNVNKYILLHTGFWRNKSAFLQTCFTRISPPLIRVHYSLFIPLLYRKQIGEFTITEYIFDLHSYSFISMLKGKTTYPCHSCLDPVWDSASRIFLSVHIWCRDQKRIDFIEWFVSPDGSELSILYQLGLTFVFAWCHIVNYSYQMLKTYDTR